MSETTSLIDTLHAGQELAALCREHHVDPSWIDGATSLDDLIARVLEELEQRAAPIAAADDTTESSSARRVCELARFARRLAALRDRAGDAAFVAGIEDLERLRIGAKTAPQDDSLERAVELLGQVQSLCHKINNPLTSLIGRAQMLQMTQDGSADKIAKSANVIEESSRRIAALVQELGQVACHGKEELLVK